MPLIIENNYDQLSLLDLVQLREAGYSVVKSPHVGNQHPSNLVCAALGIPLEMVTFTQGLRDTNFHPHLRIRAGQQTKLYDPKIWTPFAKVGQVREIPKDPDEGFGFCFPIYAIEDHQESVEYLFPNTEVVTDMERMRQYPALTATVLRATNIKRPQSVWYRRVSKEGIVTNRSKGQLTAAELETDVFDFTSHFSGWVIPNKVHIIFALIYQTLSSGRSTVYHLSGPQMVHYIDGLAGELSLLYDAVRRAIPDLPAVLRARIVPVASARFVTVPERVEGLSAWRALVQSGLEQDEAVREFVASYPEYTAPLESATTLSQYDFYQQSDIKIDADMLHRPLAEVTQLQQRLSLVAQSLSIKAAE